MQGSPFPAWRWPIMAVPLAVLLLTAGARTQSAPQRIGAIAVFPVENLSGGPTPSDQVRGFLIERLVAAGIKVLRNEALDDFMTQHRVRYAAGIDVPTAELLRKETGVDGALFAAIELANDTAPPKFALIVRLASLGELPTIAWADDAGVAGDDAPGFFDLDVVNDRDALRNGALKRIGDSLLGYLTGGATPTDMRAASKFKPKAFYRKLTLPSDRPSSVAVLPFFNLSDRRNAGEILALLFARHLSGFGQVRVVEPGAVRRQLLDARIIMDSGVSTTDAETVAALLDADYVLGGRVTCYEDYEGPAGRTRVQFSTVLVDRKGRRIVWSSDSSNEGSDGVRLFERGTSRTAHSMATQMVRLTTQMIVGRGR